MHQKLISSAVLLTFFVGISLGFSGDDSSEILDGIDGDSKSCGKVLHEFGDSFSIINRHHFPWSVTVVAEFQGIHWPCQGTVVGTNLVLTTASCIYKADRINVVLSSAHANITVTTTVYETHPNFSRNYGQDNVALVYLPSRDSSWKNKAICLPGPVSLLCPRTGERVLVVSQDSTLLCRVTSSKRCRDSTIQHRKHRRRDSVSEVCIDCDSALEICSQDEGSPVVHAGWDGAWVQIGMVSLSANEGCRAVRPFRVTRMDGYSQWIRSASVRLQERAISSVRLLDTVRNWFTSSGIAAHRLNVVVSVISVAAICLLS